MLIHLLFNQALHLELTDLLSAESFLLAFRRFVGRGLPSTIWSDNAKTFKTASKEIQKIICNLFQEVVKYLTTSLRSLLLKENRGGEAFGTNGPFS